jgi:peptidoglycan/LPS O-acetylase OafA/YrhL
MSGYMNFLDGLRCMSVLWVILIHLPIQCSGILGLVKSRGWMGVDMFFVISGYLITSILIREKESTGRINLKNFYIRRSLRIWPIYYIILISSLLIALLCRSYQINIFDIAPQHILSTIKWPFLYLSNVYVSISGSENIFMLHSWSLALEEQFYLLWPLLLLSGKERSLKVGYCIIFFCTLWRIILTYQYPEGLPAMTRIFYGFDTRLDTILYGATLALLIKKDRPRYYLHKLFTLPFFVPSTLLLFIMVIYKTNRWSGWFGNSLGYGLSAFLMAVILAYIILMQPKQTISILEQKPFVYVGKISYGIYLYHIMVLDAFKYSFGTPDSIIGIILFSTTIVIVTIAIASLSYSLIEAPILKFKNKFQTITL